MTEKVKVKSYYRDGEKVRSHTRSLPGEGGVKISQVLASNSENNPKDTLEHYKVWDIMSRQKI